MKYLEVVIRCLTLEAMWKVILYGPLKVTGQFCIPELKKIAFDTNSKIFSFT